MKKPPRDRRAFWCTVATWTIAVCAASAMGQSQDERFLDGLRDRRLFELAERYARQRLEEIQSGDLLEAEMRVELIRTLALHAAHAPPQEREPLWTAAREEAAVFLRRTPPHPRALLVRMQDALTLLAQGELGRQEHEAGALPATELPVVQQALREATDLLESLDKELTREIPLRHRTTPRGGELSADELNALHRHVEHQLGRARRNRALLFERASDDRLAMLLAANETLQSSLVKLRPDDPLAAKVRLDLVECQRLLGRLEQARDLASSLDMEGLEADVRLHARAELLRIAVAGSDFEAAQEIIGRGRLLRGQASAELDFAQFEAFLAFARAAHQGTLRKDFASGVSRSPAELAEHYGEQAAQAARFLNESHGAYWGRRADQFLVAALPRSATGRANVELLGRAADSLLVKGDLSAAIKAYDEATAAAKAASDWQAVFELSYKAALVEQQRGSHGEAARRLRTLARSLGTHEQAPAAHLLAAWNAGQQARSEPAAAETYRTLLREHLTTWPNAETADQARLWLGKVLESNDDLAGAIEAYSGVSRASSHYPSAMTALATTWRHHLMNLAEKTDSGDVSQTAQQAVRFFQTAIVGPENRLPERWTDADRMAALAAAELTLLYCPADATVAEGILRTALAHTDDASAAWQAAARAQLVIAIAGQGGRHEEAVKVMREIGDSSPAQLLAVLEGLASIAARGQSSARREIARIQLVAAEQLNSARGNLTARQTLSLDRLRAEALAAVGEHDEAIALYERLVQQEPGNGPIQEGFASILLTSANPAHRKRALDQWRIVASRTAPRTPSWYKAKYSVALAQFQLGDRSGAATLLRYMLETPPGLKDSGWESAYRDLLKQCER